MNKEEVLKSNDVNIDRWVDTKSLILKSMDDYAMQMCKQDTFKVHLSTLFEKQEDIELFCNEIIKMLNDITFNGQRKIANVKSFISISISVPSLKGSGYESYWLSLTKQSKVTLD